MIKSELIKQMAKDNPHLFHRDVELVVNAILDEISDNLCKGNRVELRGFGTFSVRRRQERRGRNPKTGEEVRVDEKCVPFFKSGKEIRDRLNMDK